MLERIQSHHEQSSSNQRACGIYHRGDLLCLFTGTAPCVIRRWAFLILGFIDPLSCIPPPTTLLSTFFGRGAGSWHSPRTQKVVKNRKGWFCFDTLRFVWAHHRARATTPSLTLFENNLSSSAHFSTIMSERKGSKREFFDIWFRLLILNRLASLFISQCPYKFSSFLDLRNAFNRFRLFSRDFRLFLFFFHGSACFSSLASPRNLPS